MSAVKKNYIFNFVLTGFNIIFPIISFPYAAKILGPEGIGKVQFVLSYTQYFALIAALGIPIYGVRIISQSTHDEQLLNRNLGQLISIHILCCVGISIIFLSTILAFSFFDHDRTIYLLAGLIIVLGFTSLDWYFTGVEKFKLIAIRSVVVKIISLIFLFVFVKTKADYGIYLAISVFSILGNNLYNLFSIRKNIKLSFKGFGNHLKPLMYTFGTTVATSMYTLLDTVLLGFFANDKSVGLYSASVKLTKISIPFIISSAIVLMPRISKLFGKNDMESLNIVLNKSFNFIVIVAVPVCFALMILAPQLIYVFSGSQFNEAIVTMRILSPLTLIIGLGYFWGFQILIPAGKEKEMLVSVLLGMGINLLLNFILIPIYKQNGAAVANVISEIAVTFGYMFFCLKVVRFKISHKSLVYNGIAALPLIFIALCVNKLVVNIYYQLILSGIMFFAIYFFIQIKLFKNSIVKEMMFSLIKRR